MRPTALHMKHGKFLKNAFIISLGGFISRIIGALYKIPLNNLIGCKGTGLYQLAYLFYSLTLTLTSSGATSAVTKLVAEYGRGADSVFKAALSLFGATGALGGLAMLLFGGSVARIQGNPSLYYSYIALSPAVPFVAVLSVYRGWFQGKNDMRPTAVSEINESVIRALVGISLVCASRGDVSLSVAAALFGVTVGELFSMLYIIREKNMRPSLPLYCKKIPVSKIISTALPVAASQSVLPVSGIVDSFIIVRLLKPFSEDPVSLYGLFSGGALTLVNLPVSVCYGFAVAVLPKIASAYGEREKNKSVYYALGATFVLSLFCAVGLFLFGNIAVNILFHGFSPTERETTVSLVRILSLSAVFLSMAQTLSACLTAKGMASVAALNTLAAAIVKSLLFFVFINEKNGVMGAGYSLNICNFLLFVLNLVCNLFTRRRKDDNDSRTRCRGRRSYQKG